LSDDLAVEHVSCGFPEGHFDLVTLIDVIEHLPDPKATMREVGRVTKPGGVQVVARKRK
jgi:2-polyprenyl-3-methyl-5-hydroxy-6-metoxy-1,4-benzoquinol methylase